MKFIIVLSVVAFLTVQLKYSTGEEFACQQGVSYTENECNGCFCGPSGSLGCTLKACPNVDSKKLYNCQVGTSYEKGCNKCWCIKDQGTICTNKEC